MENTERNAFFKLQAEMLYGKVLDLARVSSMTDRSFQQFEKDIKRMVRESFDGVQAVMEEEINKK